MRLSGRLLGAAVCSCLILSITVGCATYETQKNVPASEGGTLSKESSVSAGAVDFRCCSLAEKNTCRNYLGIDPASTGMVPLLLKVQNNGNDPVKIDLTHCFLTTSQEGETFNALALNDACERARRGDASVIGAAIAFGAIGAVISGTQTAQANRTLDQDYYDKCFKPTMINAGAKGEGVIFFDAPKEKQDLLRSLIMTTIDVNTMERKETQIELPR